MPLAHSASEVLHTPASVVSCSIKHTVIGSRSSRFNDLDEPAPDFEMCIVAVVADGNTTGVNIQGVRGVTKAVCATELNLFDLNDENDGEVIDPCGLETK